MRRGLLLSILGLVGCGNTSPDTAESLATHPDRLKEIMRQCREYYAKAGDPVCDAASEAFRRRFMADGKAQYTPQP